MGRLPALTWAALALVALGCDEGGKPPAPPVPGRSNAVAAASQVAAAVTASARPAPAAPARKLCDGSPPNRPAPRQAVRTATAGGASPLPAGIAFGTGKWIWVNLWAAWCAPCKEELPRIKAFQDKLRAAGVLVDVAFVSIDDDERQLHRFLDGQPPQGVRASYWLPEGSDRAGFLGGLGLRESVELPVQAFVAPSGQVACVAEGAIEDRDFGAIAALMGAPGAKL